MTFEKILSEHDAFLQIASAKNADQYYQTRFKAPDKYIYIRTKDEKILATSRLEYGRAQKEASVDRVINTSEYRENSDSAAEMIQKLLEDLGIQKIAVPRDFALYMGDELREKGLEVTPIENPTGEQRKIKSSDELQKLRAAQQVTEKAMEMFRDVLSEASEKGGELYYQGDVLTSDRAKSLIEKFLIEKNCKVPEDTIVACGEDSAQPHNAGEGPLKSGQPIIVDIFPRHSNLYFGDMTRTFVKGEPCEKLQEMHSVVEKALEQALDMVSPGVKGEELHEKVCEVFEENGFETTEESGFLHSTGHGVGLELHEKPGLVPGTGELKPGMVITVEPGLYIPGIGGVRIEDMIAVTEDGYEDFNEMSYNMVI